MKKFTQNFIGLLALVFTICFSSYAQSSDDTPCIDNNEGLYEMALDYGDTGMMEAMDAGENGCLWLLSVEYQIGMDPMIDAMCCATYSSVDDGGGDVDGGGSAPGGGSGEGGGSMPGGDTGEGEDEGDESDEENNVECSNNDDLMMAMSDGVFASCEQGEEFLILMFGSEADAIASLNADMGTTFEAFCEVPSELLFGVDHGLYSDICPCQCEESDGDGDGNGDDNGDGDGDGDDNGDGDGDSALGCTDAWGNTHESGSSWNDGACTECYCDNGQISCVSEDCEIPECEAPNFLQDVEGACCPVCVEDSTGNGDEGDGGDHTACEDDSNFDIGFGDCSSYAIGLENHSYCVSDGADIACPQACGTCDEGNDDSGDDNGDDNGDENDDSCDEGFVVDCSGDGDCAPNEYIGDGYCDGVDQIFGVDLTCYDNDGGDCATDDNGDTGGDCVDNNEGLYEMASMFGDTEMMEAMDAGENGCVWLLSMGYQIGMDPMIDAMCCATFSSVDDGDGDGDGDTACGDDQFTCNNGECIPAYYYDDGASECGTADWPADCSDGSDEPCTWEDGDGDDGTVMCSDPVACNYGLSEECLYALSSASFDSKGDFSAHDESWMITDIAPSTEAEGLFIGIFEFSGGTDIGDSFNNTVYFVTINIDEASGVLEVYYGGNEVFGYTDEVGGFTLQFDPDNEGATIGMNDCEGDGDVIEGCMVEFACNYNSEANSDDGSCVWIDSAVSDEVPLNDLWYGHEFNNDAVGYEYIFIFGNEGYTQYYGPEDLDLETPFGEFYFGICENNDVITYNDSDGYSGYWNGEVIEGTTGGNDFPNFLLTPYVSDDGTVMCSDPVACNYGLSEECLYALSSASFDSKGDFSAHDESWMITDIAPSTEAEGLFIGIFEFSGGTDIGDSFNNTVYFVTINIDEASGVLEVYYGGNEVFGYTDEVGGFTLQFDPDNEGATIGMNDCEGDDCELDSPDIINGLCDCEGNQWDEYCYDNDGDGLGDISTIGWFCPSSIEDGYILNCDDSGCVDDLDLLMTSPAMEGAPPGADCEMAVEHGMMGWDPIMDEACCETFSNFNPSDMCESGDCIQDCYGMWLDHSMIDEYYSNGQCDDFMNCGAFNFDNGECGCYDNEDELLSLFFDGQSQSEIDNMMPVIDAYGGACSFVVQSYGTNDPIIQTLCCETISNFDQDECTDNDDALIAGWASAYTQEELVNIMQEVEIAGGACNLILNFGYMLGDDPVIETLCCETLSNFNPSDMCESGDCIQDCYGMWLDHSMIDEYYSNGQCDDFMNCGAFNFDNEACDGDDNGYEDCDDNGWEDSYGDGCDAYAEFMYCTPEGEYGPGWDASWGTFADYAVDGMDAIDACCACGGGNIDDSGDGLVVTACHPDHIENGYHDNFFGASPDLQSEINSGDVLTITQGNQTHSFVVNHTNYTNDENCIDEAGIPITLYIFIEGDFSDAFGESLMIGSSFTINSESGNSDCVDDLDLLMTSPAMEGAPPGANCEMALDFGLIGLDPIMDEACCETFSNFNPSDMCESGDCIQDCYGMWLDHSMIDQYYSNGQCDDFMNCGAFNFDNEACGSDPSAFIGTWSIVSWMEEGEEGITDDVIAYFNFYEWGEFSISVYNEISYGQFEVSNDNEIIIIPEPEMFFAFSVSTEGDYLILTDEMNGLVITLMAVESIYGCLDPNNPAYNQDANAMDFSYCEEGCFDENACNFGQNDAMYCDYYSCCTNPDACNYGEEEDCYEPEGDCDCEGNAPDYSNLSFEVSMEGYEYTSVTEEPIVEIHGTWNDSDILFYIPLSMTNEGDYFGDFNGTPGMSFTYYVSVNGELYGQCDGNPYWGEFNNLDTEYPCWVSNNTRHIAPFSCQYILTCNGDQYYELEWILQAEELIGNGHCDADDGWSLNFNCEEFDYENGDCAPDCAEYIEIDVPLNLEQGWNIFGYTCFEPIDVVVGFNDIVPMIEVVKDEWGLAYLPEWDYNGIGNLNYADGYQIKMIEGVEGFQFCPIIIKQED